MHPANFTPNTIFPRLRDELKETTPVWRKNGWFKEPRRRAVSIESTEDRKAL